MLPRFRKGDAIKTSLEVLSNAKTLDVLRQQAYLTSQSDGSSQSNPDSRAGVESTHPSEHRDNRQGRGSPNLRTSEESYKRAPSLGDRELSVPMQAMVKKAHETFKEMRTRVDKPGEHFSRTPQRAFFEKYAEHYWQIMEDSFGNGEHSVYLAAVDQKIKECFENSQLWYRIHPMTLKEILKSEKPLFKTVHETGTTGGTAFAGGDLAMEGFQKVRRQLEFVYLNCPQDMDPAKTPLSVYITNHPDGHHLLVWTYGSVAISLKKEIKKRTFGILGDSYMLGIGAQLHPYPKAPDWLSTWLPKSAKDLLWPGPEKSLSPELAKLEQETPSSVKLYAFPTPLDNPTRECWPMKKWYPNSNEIAGSFLPNWKNPCHFGSNPDKLVTSYAEGLIDRRKGPVTIGDIEEVVFYNPKKVDDELKALLKERDISYRYASNIPFNPGNFLNPIL